MKQKLIQFLFWLFITPVVFAQINNDSLVVTCFNQGAANNCASIALIKAAMLKYGFNHVVNLQISKNDYKITYRDGTKLSITEEERLEAVTYAKLESEGSVGFQLKDSVLFYVYLYYASIAKFIEKYGYWGCEEDHNFHFSPMRNYDRALKFISKTSYCTDNCYRLLGLSIKGSISDFKPGITILENGSILYSWRHAVAVYNNMVDCFGEWVESKGPKSCQNKFEWYITLQ